jgi:predicted nuclease of predicted toxin-antitoxin system
VKLLFDENLSPRLADVLDDIYPGSVHVHHCGLGSTDDSAIWQYAKANGHTIVSKDSDFQERSILLTSAQNHLASRNKL